MRAASFPSSAASADGQRQGRDGLIEDLSLRFVCRLRVRFLLNLRLYLRDDFSLGLGSTGRLLTAACSFISLFVALGFDVCSFMVICLVWL
jgi:hypothetical protein